MRTPQMEIPVVGEAGGAADLISRIRRGDQHAEAQLVESYSRDVMIIIRRDVSDAAIADDLWQETLWIVLKKIRQGDVREPEKLSGFVYAVARNLVIEYFRAAARQERLTETEDVMFLADPTPDPLEELMRKEEADLVRQILEEMPNKRDSQVLFRFYIAEDEKEQICADLGLTGIRLNLVLHRARGRYRELYERALSSRQKMSPDYSGG
jgi:RNA polymerase sigma-70 factor (ECF subfamily)